MSNKRTINESPKKSKKRLTYFQDIWLSKDEYKDWLRKVDDFKANCILCKT